MKVNHVPEGCHSITPYLTVPDAARLVEFLKQAFDGVERARITRPDGTILHAQVRVGDSLLMIGEPQGHWQPMPSMLYFYVPDVDAVYQRALAAGSKSMVEPANMFYGDRHACVKDFADNQWWLATRMEELSLAEIQKRAIAFYNDQKSKNPNGSKPMATQDNCCTIAPYFKVKSGQLDAFKKLCERFVAKSSAEPDCLYYGFAFDGDLAHCREGYTGAEPLLAHVQNVGALLDEAAKISDLVRLEIHGPEKELAKLRGPMAGLKAQFFTLEFGFRK